MATTTKALKFRYCMIKIQNGDGSRKNFKFAVFITKMTEYLNIHHKCSIDIKDFKAKIDRYTNVNDRYIHISMTKLSDKVIPQKSYEDDRDSQSIDISPDEYLGLDVHMIYDTAYSVLMLQISRESLSEKNIAEYINFFAHRFKMLNDDQCVFIEPIYDVNAKRSSIKPKKIEIRFANLEHVRPKKESTLSTIIDSFNRFDGISGTVTISVGRLSKKNDLNSEEISEAIDDLKDLNTNYPQCISSAKLSYTENDTSFIYDLFDNVLNDYGKITIETRSSLKYDDVEVEMLRLLTQKLPHIEKILNHNIND